MSYGNQDPEMKITSSIDKDSIDKEKRSTASKKLEDDEDDLDFSSKENDMPSTPQDSEYVSIQEYDETIPEGTEDVFKVPIDIATQIREDPPVNQMKSPLQKVEKGDPVIPSFAGYGLARQFSTKLHTSSPKPQNQKLASPSPKYTTPRRSTSSLKVKETNSAILLTEDELFPQIKKDPPSIPDNKVNLLSPQPTLASKQGKLSGVSPDSYTQGSSSNAMKGAREILKKNRQERLALMTKRRPVPHRAPSDNDLPTEEISGNNENKDPIKTKTLYSHARSRSVTPNKKRFQSETKSPVAPLKQTLSPSLHSHSHRSIPKTPPSASHKVSGNETGFGSPKSDVSGASSGWTEDPDSTDKDSRRALILKMAKNRMRSKKEIKSPS